MAAHADLIGMLEVDRVIHEPARLVILAVLHNVDSADFLYLMRELNLTRGNLSSHLAKLEQADYIRIEKTYREKTPLTICHITDTGRRAFEAYRSQLDRLTRIING